MACILLNFCFPGQYEIYDNFSLERKVSGREHEKKNAQIGNASQRNP